MTHWLRPTRTRIILEAEHPVRDEGEEERLEQVVGQLDQALRDGEGQLVVHTRRTLAVHHLQSQTGREIVCSSSGTLWAQMNTNTNLSRTADSTRRTQSLLAAGGRIMHPVISTKLTDRSYDVGGCTVRELMMPRNSMARYRAPRMLPRS